MLNVSYNDLPFGALKPTRCQQALISFAGATGLRRGWARHSMSSLINVLRPSPVDAYFMNAPFRLYPASSAIDCAMLFSPNYNRKEIEFLISSIPEDGVFVDIGANIGMYSLPIAKRINGRVFSIEPHPEALKRLKFNIETAKLSNIAIINSAVGDSAGTICMNTNQSNLANSFITKSGDVEVRISPLLDLIKENGLTKIDAMKIDIEGYEDRALTPFFRNAPRDLWPKVLCVESVARHNWSSDIIKNLKDQGYRIEFRTKSNLLLSL